MRALLVVNPNATTTTPGGRDVITRALGSELKLDVLETTCRGHAARAAAEAAVDGFDVVVVHGGDGTVNEVVNGMLDAPGAEAAGPWNRPAVAVVPGGSANVFARALGSPRDPVEATATILDALREQRDVLVGLGRVEPTPSPRPRAAGHPGGRWFTFNAGLGWDAEVVAAVEEARAAGREATPLRYAGTAVKHYVDQLRRPRSMTVEISGAAPVPDVRLAFITTTHTWTYLGSRAVRTNPGTSIRSGLGLFGMRDLGAGTIASTLRRMLAPGGDPRGRNVLRQDAVASVTVRCAEPVALQVDGDLLGRHREVRFRAVRDALRVVV
ncbi:diacylglycerol/lipid kinase family protein [Pseudonocardia lacus]|uniref:diacylglycerol/lipid kinase family protein n=1 Tax=Pseudonocardia lacus TaxID=2835865 RepID=UPI001BDD42A5|nr:diacylglycerol kinase family protein [Pseudonocardia lacus]